MLIIVFFHLSDFAAHIRNKQIELIYLAFTLLGSIWQSFVVGLHFLQLNSHFFQALVNIGAVKLNHRNIVAHLAEFNSPSFLKNFDRPTEFFIFLFQQLLLKFDLPDIFS